jgi:hypothetical protein
MSNITWSSNIHITAGSWVEIVGAGGKRRQAREGITCGGMKRVRKIKINI